MWVSFIFSLESQRLYVLWILSVQEVGQFYYYAVHEISFICSVSGHYKSIIRNFDLTVRIFEKIGRKIQKIINIDKYRVYDLALKNSRFSIEGRGWYFFINHNLNNTMVWESFQTTFRQFDLKIETKIVSIWQLFV